MSNPRDSLHDLRMFLTTEYACSYLPGRQARNLVADPAATDAPLRFRALVPRLLQPLFRI